eukprot:3088652-Rhodomonas_salina.1
MGSSESTQKKPTEGTETESFFAPANCCGVQQPDQSDQPQHGIPMSRQSRRGIVLGPFGAWGSEANEPPSPKDINAPSSGGSASLLSPKQQIGRTTSNPGRIGRWATTRLTTMTPEPEKADEENKGETSKRKSKGVSSRPLRFPTQKEEFERLKSETNTEETQAALAERSRLLHEHNAQELEARRQQTDGILVKTAGSGRRTISRVKSSGSDR